jgi:arylsulfatase A-like enzyme
VSSPSRGALLTGCYPRRIGFDEFDGHWVLFPGQPVGLHPAEITFARILKDAGYATLHVGKWHCGDQPEFLPTRFGFDHYFGIPYSNDMGRQGGRERFPPLPLLRDEAVIQQQPDQAGLIERYVEEAVRFFRAERERPFLLYLAPLQVHLPLYAPARFLRESRNDRYGATVAAADWATGVLLHELAALGLERNTLVLFTSDNGSRGDHGGSNAPLRGGKGTTWEGGQRVPLLARWPGQVPAGRVCREMLASLDLLPTFAGLAGAAPPADRTIDGRDARPLLLGSPGAASPRETFFYYFRHSLDAVRAGRWKLFAGRNDGPKRERRNGLCELYDLESDPGETTDVHDRHPGVVRDLAARIEACRRDLGDGATGVAGSGCRPVGRVAEGRPLTQYDPAHPYLDSMYDLPDAG